MRQFISRVDLASRTITRRLQVPAIHTTSLDGSGRRIATVSCERACLAGNDNCCGSCCEESDGCEDGELHDGCGGAARHGLVYGD
jgi:hypothetical protein